MCRVSYGSTSMLTGRGTTTTSGKSFGCDPRPTQKRSLRMGRETSPSLVYTASTVRPTCLNCCACRSYLERSAISKNLTLTFSSVASMAKASSRFSSTTSKFSVRQRTGLDERNIRCKSLTTSRYLTRIYVRFSSASPCMTKLKNSNGLASKLRNKNLKIKNYQWCLRKRRGGRA